MISKQITLAEDYVLLNTADAETNCSITFAGRKLPSLLTFFQENIVSVQGIRSVMITMAALGLVLVNSDVRSQSHDKILSILLYNFAINGQWPGKEANEEFTIAVLGDHPVTSELRSMASSKTIGQQKIKIIEYANGSEVEDCHMLFIPKSKSQQLSAVTSKLPKTSTLIITEKDGLGKNGTCINFIMVDGSLRFQINEAEVEKRNIKLTTKIKTFAIAI